MSPFARWIPTLLAAAVACAPPPSAIEPAAAKGPVEIPHPDLGTMEDTVRRRLESLRGEIETSGGVPAEQARRLGTLGRAYMAYAFPRAAEACFVDAQRLEAAVPDAGREQ